MVWKELWWTEIKQPKSHRSTKACGAMSNFLKSRQTTIYANTFEVCTLAGIFKYTKRHPSEFACTNGRGVKMLWLHFNQLWTMYQLWNCNQIKKAIFRPPASTALNCVLLWLTPLWRTVCVNSTLQVIITSLLASYIYEVLWQLCFIH